MSAHRELVTLATLVALVAVVAADAASPGPNNQRPLTRPAGARTLAHAALAAPRPEAKKARE